MLTKEQLAKRLNGGQYRHETSLSDEKEAKDNNLVIVFGASDDLIELRGAIHDELESFDGGVFKIINRKGGWKVLPDNVFYKEKKKLSDYGVDLCGEEIEAVWSPDEPECSWLIKTEIPHATFDILEEGELYCRGIVFSTGDLKHLQS